jgi:hypothetical protein
MTPVLQFFVSNSYITIRYEQTKIVQSPDPERVHHVPQQRLFVLVELVAARAAVVVTMRGIGVRLREIGVSE